MKISYRWLKEYVDVSEQPAALANTLTMAGLEVEEVVQIGAVPQTVIVGAVKDVAPHPDADRLTVCTVDIGTPEPLQIICGAQNVREGQNVAVATIGTRLELPSVNTGETRSPVTIRKAKIRGVLSQGMICAEDELGLSDDHSGIMVLKESARVGTSLRAYLDDSGAAPEDTVLDIAITPNRPDAVSHIGVARDVAALTESVIRIPAVTVPDTSGKTGDLVRVTIENPGLCHRYAGIVVKGVTVGDSPAWLRHRLEAIGLRPRNNVVDITNYVMYECGQPLHAFDLGAISGAHIIVRTAGRPMPFTTLDDVERTLAPDTLMICDADREVAIAGVMGGQNSEVTGDTTDVLIESAYFDPSSIRRTAKRLGLQTDASYRFERGVDPAGQVWAAKRTADLMAELAGGTVVQGVVDAHPTPHRNPTVAVRMSRVERILGVRPATGETIRLLTAIGFEVEQQADETLVCTVPSFRPDVEREVDVIEEIARLYGFDRIVEPPSLSVPSFTPRGLQQDIARDELLSLLRGNGYREVYTNSLLSESRASAFYDAAVALDAAGGTVVTTANAITQEMSTLRPSLLPGLLDVARHNLNHGRSDVRVFELGHVFTRREGLQSIVPGFHEYDSLCLLRTGSFAPRSWATGDAESDFFDIKGAVSNIFAALRLGDIEEEPRYSSSGVTSYSLVYRAGNREIGMAGRVSPDRLSSEGVDGAVYFAELNWTQLLDLAGIGRPVTFRPGSRFPVVERDLAFVVDQQQDVGPVLDVIRSEAHLLADLSVFDVYRDDRIGAGRKSLAFALRFVADRTLRDEEVDADVERIVTAVCKTFNAVLRD